MNKKSSMVEPSLADIEQAQQDLRTSIEASKVLAEKSQQLIARHRQQAEPPAPQPLPPVT